MRWRNVFHFTCSSKWPGDSAHWWKKSTILNKITTKRYLFSKLAGTNTQNRMPNNFLRRSVCCNFSTGWRGRISRLLLYNLSGCHQNSPSWRRLNFLREWIRAFIGVEDARPFSSPLITRPSTVECRVKNLNFTMMIPKKVRCDHYECSCGLKSWQLNLLSLWVAVEQSVEFGSPCLFIFGEGIVQSKHDSNKKINKKSEEWWAERKSLVNEEDFDTYWICLIRT